MESVVEFDVRDCSEMNLLPLEGRPGLITSDYQGMGVHRFPLTSKIWGIPLTSYHIYNKLLLRDAKILLRDFIYKLYINKVYLFLREGKLFLKNSIKLIHI